MRLLLIALALSGPPSVHYSSIQSSQPSLELPPVSLEGFDAAARAQVEAAYQNLQEHPEDAAMNGRLGMRLHAYEDYAAAERWYRRAHRLDPAAFDWRYLLAVVKQAQGAGEEAIPLFRQALQVDADYEAAWLKLGEALLEAGRLDEAIEAYRLALRKWPSSWPAQFGLGQGLRRRRELTEAVKFLQSAGEAPGGYGAAHYALALALRDLGRRDEAQEQFRLYQQSQNRVPVPRDPLLESVAGYRSGPREILGEGLRLARRGDYGAAVEEHERALRLDPTLVQAHVNLIRLYGELGRHEQAERHYQALLQGDAGQPDGHYNMGVIRAAQGRFAEAAEAYGKALELNPHFALAHNNLGVMLERLGRRSDAEAHYRAAVRNDPSYRQARFNLGRALLAEGKLEEAIRQLGATLTPEDEETPRYLYALSAAHVRAKRLREARRYAEAAQAAAARWGQSELLEAIEKDLARLEKAMDRP